MLPLGAKHLWRLAEGKAKSAIRYLKKAAELDVTDSDSMRMIGKAWLSLGKMDKAMTALADAIDRDPKDPWAHFEFGKALERKQEFDGAEESYRKAIELRSDKSHFHYYLAQLLDEVLDDPAGALEHYKRYLELGGSDTNGAVKNRIGQLEK